MEELVSVIVPIYKVEKYMHRCVDSIINQTYKKIEIILVDDGSPDSCGKICDEYAEKDNRIKVIHKENGGLSDARNAGIDIAKGNYLTFIDSDDYVTEDYVEFLLNLLKESDADMSVCKHTIVYNDSKYIDTGTKKYYLAEPRQILEMLLYSDDFDVSTWAKLYKKELFCNIRFPKDRLFEDSATTYKLIDLCKKIAFKSESKYFYVIRDDSITTKEFNSKKFDLIKSTEEMVTYIEKKYSDLKKGCERRLMYSYLSTLMNLAEVDKKSENYEEYKKQLMEYIKKHRKEVLKDKKIPKRDRIALYSLLFGFEGFRISWMIYKKINK